MTATGFILQPTYRLREGAAVVRLFGKLSTGEAFLIEDDRFEPYFFVPADVAGVFARQRDVRLEPVELRDLLGGKVVRVVAPVPGAVPRLRALAQQAGSEALEADIRFAYRYLIDRGVRSAVTIDGEADALGRHLLRFRNPEIGPADDLRPDLQVLSLDIETTPDASQVLSVALVGAGADEVHVVAERPLAGAHAHPDEAALLRAAAARVREIDPDILTGWNVVDFDLRVLTRRSESLEVPLSLGRVRGQVGFQRDTGFTRQSRADVPGRQVLDGVALVRDAFITLDDYSLETAARTFLGRGKRIEQEGPDRAQAIWSLYREHRDAHSRRSR